MYQYQRGAVSRATIITLVSIAGLVALAVLFLPTGFSNDISQIGKGKKVAVFAFNNGTLDSMDMMHVLENVRDSYSGKIVFLAVSISAPLGKQFIRDHQVPSSTLLLFNDNGTRYATLNATTKQADLIQTLDKFIQQ